MSKSFNHCQFWESLRSRNRIYNTWQPHPQLLTSCMIGTPMFCMLVMIHFTSIGIWACCTSLAKFSSVIPTENIDELKNIMQYKFSKKGACRNSFSSTISVLTSAGQEHTQMNKPLIIHKITAPRLNKFFSGHISQNKDTYIIQLLFYIGSEALTSMTHYVVNNKSVLILPGEWCLTSFVYNIEQNDADFVVCHDVLVQKNWNNISHVIFDLLPFRVCSHCQVLKIIHDKRIKHIIYM